MNRGVLSRTAIAAAGAALVALAVLGASTLPVQQPASVTAPDDDRARVGVVCPTIGEATVLAAGSPQGRLALAALDEPDGAQPVDGALTTEPATAPMVITAPRLDPFSATTRTAASTGSDRGLSMASCPRPGASAWFTGVRSSGTGAAEVVLLNADAQDATVDLSVYAARGRVNAPGSRGIVVPARSRRVVPLGPLFTLEQAVSLQVSTSAGRVAAMVRQRMLRDDRPAGSDWVPPTADPATTVVIPGLPAGKGGRDLVVVNPGERTASVALQVLGASGPVALPGFETIELPPQTSRVVDLARPLAGGAAGLRLTSEQQIAAGVISGSGGDAATADVSTQVAVPPLTGPGVLALSPAQPVAPRLQLANGAADASAVRVVVSDPNGKVLREVTVDVPGLADRTITLPRARDVLIAVEPRAPGTIHASVGVRTELDDVLGTSSLAIRSVGASATLPPLRQDPRLGSQ